MRIHMIPQYAASSAYRQLEVLLGRIDSLSSQAPFTTLPGSGAPLSGSNNTGYRKRDIAVIPQDIKKWY